MAVVANFTYDITSGSPPTAPFTVEFTDTSTGSPNKWLWDFGDGYTSDSQNPSHTYTVTGGYTITLKAFIQTGVVDIPRVYVSGRYKESAKFSTGAAAYADWQAAAWGVNSDTNTRWLLQVDGTGKLKYLGSEAEYKFNLSLYSAGVAEMQVKFQGVTTVEGNFITDSGFSPLRTIADSTYTAVEDVSASLGDWHFSSWTDRGGFVPISSPDNNQIRGYLTATPQVRVWTASDIDTISIEIEPLTCDFVGVPVSGRNNTEVQFTDLSSAGVTAWSWRRRKAGTDDAFVEFATIQNPTKKFDKWDP